MPSPPGTRWDCHLGFSCRAFLVLRRFLSPNALMVARTDHVSMHKKWAAQESSIVVCTQCSSIDVNCVTYSGHQHGWTRVNKRRRSHAKRHVL